MIDIHSHIIFNVDDGARDISESAQMLVAAKNAGVSQIIATPHARIDVFDRNRIQENFRVLRDAAREKGIILKLGYEVHWDYLLMVDRDRYLDYCTVNTNRLLLEFSLSDTELPQNHDQMLYRLQRAGIDIIIAHPERYRFVQKDISHVQRWIDFGCKLQLDANCVVNAYGLRSKSTAKKLLRSGCYDFIASDAHCVDDYEAFARAVRLIENQQ